MQTGFTFKNKHTSDFGLTVMTKSRPVLPERHSVTADVPLRDGTLDFSAVNEYGRAFYTNRVFTAVLKITAENIYKLQQKLSRISAWLMGKGELIFDDMPEVKWEACVIDSVDYAPELQGRKALLTVNFNAEPFSYGLFDVGEDIVLDECLSLDSVVPLDINECMTFALNGTSGHITVMNLGTHYVRPVITVASSSYIGNMSITYGDTVIQYEKVNNLIKTIEFDFERFKVTDKDHNRDITGAVSGMFFELAPGLNDIEITSDTELKGTVNISYVPRFVYNSDYEELDWGEGK